MSEQFDYVEGPAGSGGPLLAGDLFSQSGKELLVPAGYLVFGPADGPYTRVDTGSGLPVSIQNSTIAAVQSGSWLVQAAQSGNWTVTVGNTVTVQASNLSIRALASATDSVTAMQGGSWVVTVQDGGGSLTVDGAVTANQGGTWNITNISGVVSLPTGAATSAEQDVGNASLASIDGKITVCNTGAVVVSGSALPTGAAVASKQPAPGAAGTASLDVLSVQGIAGMVPLSAAQAGSWTVAVSGSTVVVDGGGSLTVDGMVSAAQSGVWTVGISGSVAVTGPLTDAQLRAAAVPVSAAQSGAWNVDTVATISNVVHIDDNGGSLTVDGTVNVGNTVTVSDGGGSLTVDGTVAAAQSGTWNVGTVTSVTNPVTVQDGGGSVTVDGAVTANQGGSWNITNVSGTVSLPTGAATSSRQDTGNASLTSIDGKITTCNTGAVVVSSSALPAGAATAAKQPAPGTAGTPGADVLTVQGIAGMTALKVDGSAVTQPVSGTFWPATQPVSGTVTANQGGTWNVGTLTSVTNVVHVDDNAGSLTVDGTVTVQDGGGSVTVDGTVAATQQGTWVTRLQDGAGNAVTSAARGSERALTVQVVDAGGDQVTSFGGMQATEDDVAAPDPTGPMLMARRRDALSTETTSSGDVTALNSTAKGELYIKHADAIPVTDNFGSLTVDGTITANQGGVWNINAVSGIVNVVHVDDNAGSLTVDGTVTANQGGTWNIGTVTGITNAVHVDDNGGSLTVDGTLSTAEAVVNYTVWDETTAKILPVGGQVLEPFFGPIGSERVGILRMTPYCATHVNLRDNSGSEITAFPVTDNSGSLTVDNAGTFAVQASQSGTWAVRTQDGAGNALTSATRGSEQALSVQIVDGSGNQITSFGGGAGGGTEYIEDDASAANPVGTMLLARRRDFLSSETTTDGDNTALNSTAKGELYVKHADALPITDNASSLTVDAVNLDIRDLAYASDSVTSYQGGTWNVGTLTTITNVVHVDDNASSLTVDNAGTFAVQAAQSGTWVVRTQDGAGNALTSAARGSERALSVQIVDGSGNQVTSFGGGAQVTEDTASAGGELMTLAGVVRQDTPAGSTSTDGDYTYLKSDSVGRLWVAAVQSGTWNVGTVTTVSTITNVVHVDDNASSITVDNGGTFAVQDSQVLADNTGFTDGTSKVFAAGYIYDEVAGTALTENDVAAARINANRAQIHILEDASTRGRYATVTASNALKVDASVAAVTAKAQDGAGNNLTSAARGSERALSVQVVDGSGNQVTTFGGSSAGATSALANVSGSVSNVTLLASNASRKFAVIFNDSSAVLYVKFGTTASTTSFTYRMNAYDTLEVTAYTGKIDGIWASATGAARTTEIT